VASLWSLLAGNAEPQWHMPTPSLAQNGVPPPPPIEAGKGQVFGWHHSEYLSPSSTGPVQPEGLAVKVVAPLPECQLRAELLKGEEHGGGGVGEGQHPAGVPSRQRFHQGELFPGRRVV